MGRLRVEFPPKVLRATLPLVEISETERTYFEVVAALSVVGDGLGEQAARGILAQLNALMASCRKLDSRRSELGRTIEQDTVPRVEAERAHLVAKMAAATDAVVRRSLEQSAMICETRLVDLPTVEQNMARLDAQQMVVQQTIASVRSALARMQAAPSLLSPGVENVADAVGQINLQTLAVEEAVQEVATLSAGH